jgi:hypothetical protein
MYEKNRTVKKKKKKKKTRNETKTRDEIDEMQVASAFHFCKEQRHPRGEVYVCC